MGSVLMAAVLAGGGAADGAVVPVGFWPGGGTVWTGSTMYYGFGRETPSGFGVGVAEPYGLYQDTGRNTDVYGPGGYRRPGTGFGSAGRTRGWFGGGVGLGRWRR